MERRAAVLLLRRGQSVRRPRGLAGTLSPRKRRWPHSAAGSRARSDPGAPAAARPTRPCGSESMTPVASRIRRSALAERFRSSLIPPRAEMRKINNSKPDQQRPPPDGRMQVCQHHRLLRRRNHFVETSPKNQHSVYQQQEADEEPDRDHGTHSIYQKMIFSTINMAPTTPAQKTGR